MVDNLDPLVRRRTMQAIRSSDTKPELRVRRYLHKQGFRFTTHCVRLPGKPDLALPKYRRVVFVHGCFWHAHGCSRSTWPKSRQDYWLPKLRRTQQRDREHINTLRRLGWKVTVVWECQSRSHSGLRRLFRPLFSARMSVAGSSVRQRRS